jgi:pyochelin biosynthetic protein PchC
MTPDFQLWFRCFQAPQRVRANLVCFPPAGSSASCFRAWAARLPPGLRLLAVQYPGRQDRLVEPCLGDMHELADRVSEALRPVREPIVLFGHSLGAAAAYEVAHRLEARGMNLHLIVSGRPVDESARKITEHPGGDEALWEDLRRLGGTSAAVLENPELRALLLPILRSDYAMSENYRRRDTQRLRCPLAACVGDADPDVTVGDCAAWADLTSGPFQLWSFSGDHFYFQVQAGSLVAKIAQWSATDHRLELWPTTP